MCDALPGGSWVALVTPFRDGEVDEMLPVFGDEEAVLAFGLRRVPDRQPALIHLDAVPDRVGGAHIAGLGLGKHLRWGSMDRRKKRISDVATDAVAGQMSLLWATPLDQ